MYRPAADRLIAARLYVLIALSLNLFDSSDVAGIARGAVSLCRVAAHAAAVSKAGSQNELVPNLRAGLASGIETGIAALLKSRAAVRKQPVPRAPALRKPRPKARAKQI